MGTPPNVVKAVEESSKQYNALTSLFVATCLYVAIAATSTNHKMLLLGGSLELPILKTPVSVVGFYSFAPFLLVILHVFLMLQQHILFIRRAHLRLTDTSGEEEFLMLPSLPILRRMVPNEEQVVRELLRITLFVINFVLPFWTLCLVQYKFLPYGDLKITAWHQVLIAGDLFAARYFLLWFPDRRPRRQRLPRRSTFMRELAWLAGWVVLFFSLIYAAFPGTLLESLLGRHSLVAERNLRLPSQLLLAEEPSQEIFAALEARGEEELEPPDALRERNERMYLQYAVGVGLAGRNLREADFEEVRLFNADLRGADLQGASLVGANLRGAHLTPSGGVVDNLLLGKARSVDKVEAIELLVRTGRFRRTSLVGAQLRDADLRNANLILADLRNADLRGAILTGVELTGADLRGARLQGAFLEGTELSSARLDGAWLDGAHLDAATLDRASLVNASLMGTSALGASFAEADLEGARMAQSYLLAADFRGASLAGSDLRGAFLQGATSMSLELLDARGAHLGGACKLTFPGLVDFRLVDFQPFGNWGLVEERLRSISHAVGQDIANLGLERVKAAAEMPKTKEQQAACLGTPVVIDASIKFRRLLYFDQQRAGAMQSWPALAEQGAAPWDEAAFHRELASELVQRACSKPELAKSLAFRSAGESGLGNLAFGMELSNQILSKLRSGEKCHGIKQLPRFLKRQIEWLSRSVPQQLQWVPPSADAEHLYLAPRSEVIDAVPE